MSEFSFAQAWGNYAKAFLALLTAWSLKAKASFSVPLVSLFSVVGLGELIYAGIKAVKYEAFNHTEAMYYLLGWYVPALIVTHVIIIMVLMVGAGNDKLTKN